MVVSLSRLFNRTAQEMIGGQYSRGQRTGSEKNGTVYFINRIGLDRSTSEGNTGDCTENERILVEATGSDWLFNLLRGEQGRTWERTGDDFTARHWR